MGDEEQQESVSFFPYKTKSTHLLAVVENNGTGALNHGKDHDGAQFTPYRHGHVGKGWQLMHELQ